MNLFEQFSKTDSGALDENLHRQSQDSRSNDFLREEYTIDTPENVTFGYEVLGIGSRFIGVLFDSLNYYGHPPSSWNQRFHHSECHW